MYGDIHEEVREIFLDAQSIVIEQTRDCRINAILEKRAERQEARAMDPSLSWANRKSTANPRRNQLRKSKKLKSARYARWLAKKPNGRRDYLREYMRNWRSERRAAA